MPEEELNEAEKAVLGGCIQDRDIFYSVSSQITPDDFASEVHQTIFSDLIEQRTKTGFADSASFLEFLQTKKDLDKVGGQTYILSLVSYAPMSDEVRYYLDIIKDKSLVRHFFKLTHKIEDDFKNKSITDIPEFIGEAEKQLVDVTSNRRASEFLDPAQVLKALKQKMKDDRQMRKDLHITDAYLNGYPTGYDDVDRLTSGFHPNDLIILAARPSVGKTALALNFAQKAAKTGKAVGIFSLEMRADQVLLRILSEESGVPTHAIMAMDLDNLTGSGYGDSESQAFAVASAIKTVSAEKLFIDDTSALKLSDIVTKARKLKVRYPDLALIVIDYLGLITAPSKGNANNRQQEVSDITRGLKAMARDLAVPVMVLCQLSRGVESRNVHKPVLSDLRDSGSIEQDADMVFFIYRADYYDKEGKEEKPGSYQTPKPVAKGPDSYISETELILAKNRNGPVGTVKFTFYRDTCRFEAIAEGYDDSDPGDR
jgi:replicative DNA helicase